MVPRLSHIWGPRSGLLMAAECSGHRLRSPNRLNHFKPNNMARPGFKTSLFLTILISPGALVSSDLLSPPSHPYP